MERYLYEYMYMMSTGNIDTGPHFLGYSCWPLYWPWTSLDLEDTQEPGPFYLLGAIPPSSTVRQDYRLLNPTDLNGTRCAVDMGS